MHSVMVIYSCWLMYATSDHLLLHVTHAIECFIIKVKIAGNRPRSGATDHQGESVYTFFLSEKA